MGDYHSEVFLHKELNDSINFSQSDNLKLQIGNNLQRIACIDSQNVSNGLFIKRESFHRIFVNRGLHLDKIKFYGFDMDYTLAEYKSPQYEALCFRMIQQRLIELGYPEEVKEFEYDPTFPVRGLWYDKLYGNLLKVDGFGNILVCVHGFAFLKPSEIYELYPNKFMKLDDSRIYVINTLFSLPECYMVACIIDLFSSSDKYITAKEGIKSGDLFMSYKSIFQDIRNTMDWIHTKNDSLKKHTVSKIHDYVHKDERLPVLLDRLRESGAKVFLLTNSEYWYTNDVMKYLLDFEQTNKGRDWKSYFDYIVVDGCKPLFFTDGTIMRQVNIETGGLRLGTHTGRMVEGQVYSGGCCDMFTDMIGAKGKDVLYVGDHIFGDIMKSKKTKGWRTFLIVPELAQELHVWTERGHLFQKLQDLDVVLGDLYRNLDSSTKERPNLSKVRTAIREVTHKMDMSYGMIGSLFRSGSRQTHFSTQVARYADIYASTLLNLIYYPFSYMFRAPAMLMPHESTVAHEQSIDLGDMHIINRCRSTNLQGNEDAAQKDLERTNSMVPHTRAETPIKVTHHHDEDDSEDSDKSA